MKDPSTQGKPPVTPRAAAPGGLEFQNSLVRAIHEASPDGILVVDGDGLVVSHNQRLLDIWRIPSAAVAHHVQGGAAAGTPDQDLLNLVLDRVKSPEAFLARVRELYVDPTLNDHCEVELRDGRTLERHSTMLRGEDGHDLGRVWFFRDITERKRAEAELRDLAEHDPLTGIANRRYFFVRSSMEFARARRHGRPLSLISLDIDHFKRINDAHGHAAGDEVLRKVCAACARSLREVDLLGRLGGEEFAVLLPDTALEGARLTAERLRSSVGEMKVPRGDEEIVCTVSAGVSVLSAGDTSINDILQRADQALYRAKDAGRDRVELSV